VSAADPSRLGVLALVATAALWGSNHVAARAVSEIVPLPALVLWRWVIGAGLLSLLSLGALRHNWPLIRPHLADLVIGGVIGVGLFSYFLLGGAYLSLAVEVGILTATTPVWVALIGLANGSERPSLRNGAGLALALTGALLIVCRGDIAALQRLGLGYGNLLSLLAAISFAWFTVRVRQWSRAIDPLSITVLTAWSGVVTVMLPAYLIWLATGGQALCFEGSSAQVAATIIAYVGVGPTMLGNLFYLFGVTRIGPARAAAFLYLSPVFATLLAVSLLGEQLAWHHLAGGLVIVAGLLLLGR
jgi:drug/metabolite transporter (DMT)-like permease